MRYIEFIRNLKFVCGILFAVSFLNTNAQKISLDSLRKGLLNAREDTTKIKLLQDFGYRLLFVKPDTSLILYRQALVISREDKLYRQEASLLSYISGALSFFPEKKDSALLYIQQAIALSRQNKFLNEEAQCYQILGSLYFFNWKNADSAFIVLEQGIAMAERSRLTKEQINMINTKIFWYRQLNKNDAALKFCLDGIVLSKKIKSPENELNYKNQVHYIIANSMSLDTVRFLTEKAIAWARNLQEKKYESFFLKIQGEKLNDLGQASLALKSLLESLQINKKLNDKLELASVLYTIGLIYLVQEDYRQSLSYFLKCSEAQKGIRDSSKMYTYEMIGNSYAKLKIIDSATYFAKKSYEEAVSEGNGYVPGGVLNDLGELYAELGKDSLAMSYFRRSLPDILSHRFDFYNECEIYIGMAKLFKKTGQTDSSIYYARRAFPIAQQQYAFNYIYDASTLIADFYKSNRSMDSAFYYQEMAVAANDSLFSQNKMKAIQNIEINEQIRQQQVKQDQIRYRSKINTYILLGGLTVVLLIAGILYRNNRQKQKANKVLETALSNLKSTQSQLIQSEKMASLGELTAGIAHEIQNPLNFVNNFSEVNNELIEEVKSQKLKLKSEELDELLNDIFLNNEKINHHGKRADAIVKGMLQHSRQTSGVKEPTDINALCDEYLRLAYHGLRAKDKSFNAKFETDFDKAVGKINIVPQDIGRAVLNLITNAFYAVSQKLKAQSENYEPTVTVSTKKVGDKVLISVKDNGDGIPQKVLDKIFQPFFTTKPTGQGTGLGLSLAYDIVKAHGGEIKVKTKYVEGLPAEASAQAGSEFNIILPV